MENLSDVSTRGWLAFGYLVFFGSLAGYGAFLWLSRSMTPLLANTHHYVAPALALAFSAVLLGEELTALKFVGGALALAGAALMTMHQANRLHEGHRSCSHQEA